MAGISELLSAENQASQIVVEARAGRGERMKEARLEAEAFINEVRSEKESTFQLSSIKNRDQDEALDIERDTNLSLAAMKRLFELSKFLVIDILTKSITDVSMEIPETRRLSGQRTCGQKTA